MKRTARAPTDAALPDLTNVYVLELPQDIDIDEAVRYYQADPHVEYAQPNYEVDAQWTPNDPYYSSSGSWGQPYDDLWGLRKIQAGQAWDSTQGQGMLVAVIDTGVDYGHPDLAANIWMNPNEVLNGLDDDGNGYIDDIRGWDFATGDNDPRDGHGHGTHVSGTIAALGNNGLGVLGVAPQAKIMGIKGLNDWGSGAISDLAQGIVYAARHGADVINNSWGCSSPCFSNPVAEDAVRTAAGLGVVVVFAAGNNSDDVANYSPQNMTTPKPIVVAATTPDDTPTSFTNRGLLLDLSAPGGGVTTPPPDYSPARNVLSLKSGTCAASLCDPNLIVGGAYLRQAGTSMAAPHAAGVAALVLARHPTFGNEEIRQALRLGADDLGDPGFDSAFGQGRLNAFRSVAVNAVCIAQLTLPKTNDMRRPGLIDITGTASCPALLSYQLAVGPSASGPWTVLGPMGTSSVIDGLLGQWNAATGGLYYLRLLVTDQANQTFQDLVGPVVIDADLHGGWPQRVGGMQLDSPPFVVVDLTGDGPSEVVVGDLAGRLHVFNHAGNELPGWPQHVGGPIISDVTAADVDQDGTLELFVVTSGATDYVCGYRSNGTPLPGWPQPIQGSRSSFHSIVAADVDRDGTPELIVVPAQWYWSSGWSYTHVFRGNGVRLYWWPVDNAFDRLIDSASGPAVADLDGNGTIELVIPILDTRDTFYYLYVFDVAGNLLRRLRLDGISAIISRNNGVSITTIADNGRPVLGDMDNDGDVELAIAKAYRNDYNSHIGKLFIWSYDGGAYTPLFGGDLNGGKASQLALGDLNGDGDLEVVLGAQGLTADGSPDAYSFARVFHHDGSLLWRSTDLLGLGFFRASPILGDFDGNGFSEVAFRGSWNHANQDHSTLQLYGPWNATGPQHVIPGRIVWWDYAAPAVADLDGNHDAELVTMNPEAGVITVLDLPGAFHPARIEWPQFQHNAQRTGRFPPRSNRPPVLDPIGNRTTPEAQLLTVVISASDPNGDILAYGAISLPAGASFTPSSRTFTWTPGYDQAGSYQVTFMVGDPGGLMDAETITITVEDAAETTAFQESAGQVVMEAEHFATHTPRGGFSWNPETTLSGYAGTGYLTALPDTTFAILNTNYLTTSPELVFRVNFTTPGTYYVWVRGARPNDDGDSLHAGVDGTGPASADRLLIPGPSNTWTWSRTTMDAVPATLVISTPGLHTIHLWMRENGARVDRLLLRTNSSSTPPTGTGPVESVHGGTDTTSPVISNIIATDLTATSARITWTTDEPATSQVAYGLTSSYGQTAPLPLEATLRTSHEVTVTNLTAATLYHFQVRSNDAANNPAASTDRTFTTLAAPPPAFQESAGQVVMEAEHFATHTPRGGFSWNPETTLSGYAGTGYLTALPDTTFAILNTNYLTTSPELVFRVNFTTPGTYYVWVRGARPNDDGDSLHAGVDGTGPASADRLLIPGPSNTWTWSRTTMDAVPATLVISTPGLHTIHLWMRENGARVDRLLLRQSVSSTPPSGAGPAESTRR